MSDRPTERDERTSSAGSDEGGRPPAPLAAAPSETRGDDLGAAEHPEPNRVSESAESRASAAAPERPGTLAPPPSEREPDGRIEAHRDRHGKLTDGAYTVNDAAQTKHLAEHAPTGKSTFYPHEDAEHLALEAGKKADDEQAWRVSGEYESKAKVTMDRPVGTLGRSGAPTDTVNVYRRKSGTIHISPGSPR